MYARTHPSPAAVPRRGRLGVVSGSLSDSAAGFESHVVGVVEFKGLTFFADGEIATHSNPATFDLTNGSGPHQGYVVHYFDDGSTSIERYQGEAQLSADGKRTIVKGAFQCIGGTGRFEGLKGEGTYRGERLGALRTGDYVYVDTTGSCTVP